MMSYRDAMNDRAFSSATVSPPMPPAPLGPNLHEEWLLDPSVTFLNHGCFGACPKKVLNVQSELRAQLETQPLVFLDRQRKERIDAALARVGDFVGARGEDMGFVTNATEGVHAVARSLRFEAGDEILTTSHRYDAIGNTLKHVAERAGARYVEVPIDLPFEPVALVESIEQAITPRTRLVVIDHIVSISSLILPVKEIIDLCSSRGIETLIDGAHAPGMLDLDIESLGPTFYTGNLHKWVCAPKGAAFLWVRPDRKKYIHPAIISNYQGQGFNTEFDWQGTRDITPWLAAPAAIEFFKQWGWHRVRAHNHALAVWAQAHLCQRWGVEPISPIDGACIGSMVTIPLPPRANEYEDKFALGRAIYQSGQIEVPIVEVNGRRMVRISCHIYNRADDYAKLGDSLAALLNA
jgi:isopenicillin-N epimerase